MQLHCLTFTIQLKCELEYLMVSSCPLCNMLVWGRLSHQSFTHWDKHPTEALQAESCRCVLYVYRKTTTYELCRCLVVINVTFLITLNPAPNTLPIPKPFKP